MTRLKKRDNSNNSKNNSNDKGNRRSFDCASRGKAARGFAQDDTFFFVQDDSFAPLRMTLFFLG